MKKIYVIIIVTIAFLATSCENSKPKRTIVNLGSKKNASAMQNEKVATTSTKTNQNLAKSWRQDLPGGGYIDYVQHEDGSLTTTQVQPCFACHGTRICQGCGGAGGRYGRAYGGMYYPCNMCPQTGQCGQCKGEGTITTVSTTDAAGNTSLRSSNGYSAVGGPGGTIVTDPNGRSTGHPSGGGGHSGSSRSSSTANHSDEYIETIEYAPNYTGEPDNPWCDKCHEYAPRHSHIRKRVR